MMHFETGMLHNKSIDRFNQEKLYIQLTRIFLEEIKLSSATTAPPRNTYL